MEQSLVPVKISGIGTAVHEAMHVATFIYKVIDENLRNYKLLNEIFDWILWEVTIVENDAEDSAGCFRHRSWKGYTDESTISCCLSGFLGSYIMTGYKEEKEGDLKDYMRRSNDLLKFVINNNFKNREYIHDSYKSWSSESDYLKAYELSDKNLNKMLKLMREITELIDSSNAFMDMVVEITNDLVKQHTLDRAYLLSIADKYKERIILESFMRQNITCLSIDNSGRVKYIYFRV